MQLLHAGRLPPVLDTAGVAELLGMNPRTVLLMVRDGRLPGRRVPGGRKYQFLTDEVLAALAPGDGQTHDTRTSASPAPVIGAPPRTTDVDPCDVWGAAPTPRGPDWALTCLDHWMARAADAGLTVACITAPHADTRGPCVGIVAVDDLLYRV
ncbi:MAG: helix-turn-helix domain-containing protein, partial [Acidimicrobiales bacterium]